MANIYWRSIKRGARRFSDIPKEMKDLVRNIAKMEVRMRILSVEDYYNFIGEEFPVNLSIL